MDTIGHSIAFLGKTFRAEASRFFPTGRSRSAVWIIAFPVPFRSGKPMTIPLLEEHTIKYISIRFRNNLANLPDALEELVRIEFTNFIVLVLST